MTFCAWAEVSTTSEDPATLRFKIVTAKLCCRPFPTVYQAEPEDMMNADCVCVNTEEDSPSICCPPTGEIVTLPDPLFATAKKKPSPTSDAFGSVIVPDPPVHTCSIARDAEVSVVLAEMIAASRFTFNNPAEAINPAPASAAADAEPVPTPNCTVC